MHHFNFNLLSFLIFASWIHIDFLFAIMFLKTSLCKNFQIFYTFTYEDIFDDVLHSPFRVH